MNIAEAFQVLNEFWSPMPVAKHTGIAYIEHINQGVRILTNLGCTDETTICAFILHPIVQSDADYLKGLELLLRSNISKAILCLVMEYRKTANAYLPKDGTKIPSLSVDPRVNLMLMADKIQNCHDLVTYNQNHENYKNLLDYFNNWFKVLE